MKLDEMASLFDSGSGDEFESDDESEDLTDLSEALELLDSALTFMEKLMSKRNKRLHIGDEKDLKELSLEIRGFLAQWDPEKVEQMLEEGI